jgi:hypothetical protein
VSSLKERLRYSHVVARKALTNSKEASRKHYDQMENAVTFREGELALLLQRNIVRCCSKKTFFPVDGTIHRGRSNRRKSCITLRYKNTYLQGA